MRNRSFWAPVVHFAAHTYMGFVLFLIVAAPAVGLSILIDELKRLHVDRFTIAVLYWLDRAILIVDALLFVTHLAVSAVKSVKEKWK